MEYYSLFYFKVQPHVSASGNIKNCIKGLQNFGEYKLGNGLTRADCPNWTCCQLTCQKWIIFVTSANTQTIKIIWYCWMYISSTAANIKLIPFLLLPVYHRRFAEVLCDVHWTQYCPIVVCKHYYNQTVINHVVIYQTVLDDWIEMSLCLENTMCEFIPDTVNH